jgi:hypothetical protein
MKKTVIWGVLILSVILSFLVYWNYFNTYSEGNRSGILQKFSKKGNIFKTYEGELILSSIASTGNTTIASEKFLFSVKEERIAKVLFDLEGKRVTLHYEQKRGHLPWNGETDYYINSVKMND